MGLIKHFRIDFAITALALVAAFWYGSWAALALTAILIVVEIVFSFDNAAVNAKYLERLSPFWQKMFLTVGILIAVFGMRLIFPFVIVCVSGQVNPVEALHLAMEKGDANVPGTYGYILHEAHPAIAAFGGMFLLLLFLDFVFDTERDIAWLKWIEVPLARVGHLDQMSVIVAGIMLLVASEVFVEEGHRDTVLMSGLLGIITYLAVNGLASVMEKREEAKNEQFERTASAGKALVLHGRAALSLFFFLEVLDATFSFDGVIGAFAITTDPIIIALGLGVGALYVRSMTVYLVRQGTLNEYRYLEHGAHWAIGSLAVLLLITLRWEIPDVVIGLVGILFITAAFLSSRTANTRDAAAALAEAEHTTLMAHDSTAHEPRGRAGTPLITPEKDIS
ncbi:DUF475 domain-containing protein [Micrococcales bacterium 31B]|nr:DUF475 domain-containing protein [Micrococcales bacterium 31B]